MRAEDQHSMDLDQAVDRARHGDELAFAAIYKAWQPGLYRFVYAREPNVAEDICSEIWVSMAKVLPRFEGGSRELRAWIFSVARRQVAGHRRRSLRRVMVPLFSGSNTDGVPDVSGWSGGLADTEFLVEAEITAAELARKIARVLPEAQADALLLKVLGGLDASEIASVMGKKEATVRQLQHRAVLRLSKVLSRESERSVTK